MSDRDAACAAFLARAGYSDAVREPVSGDASNRRYERLTLPGGTAILMDAPTERGEDVRPFVRIARHLTGLGLSAPEIIAEDEEQGFLILEDLGDDLYARLLKPLAGDGLLQEEKRLYTAATDALVELHRAPLPDALPRYAPVMPDLAALAFDWYLAGLGETNDSARTAFVGAMHKHLDATTADEAEVMILRDYHAENLIWLPDRTGAARVGLLDFQDAMAGHPAYDLVSMLQDARRDVSPGVEAAMIDRYCAATGRDRTTFAEAYRLLGVQRNMRIVGVFARLCLRDAKAHYTDLIPRVWGHLVRDLADPALADISDIVLGVLPEPTTERLKALKDQCGTRRTA